jgi:formamidopyrimidine-DNA glycosylase
MPELPEVETTRRGLAAALIGRAIVAVDLRRGDLRLPFQPDFRERIEGHRVEQVDRRAKYLLIRLVGGDVLVAHLGMSGSFRVEGATGQETTVRLHREVRRLGAHDHVVLETSDATRVVYNDPRRFGFMFVVPEEGLGSHPRLSGIGLEPLEPALTPTRLLGALAGASAPLKAALLDQRRIAGLGNIYVCEALHLAGLSPYRSAATMMDDRAAARRLADAIRRVLTRAIEAGGSTLRDFSGADGKPGYFQHSFRVYDREGAACPRKGCRGFVVRTVQAGRSTFYCANCQV